jgi:hypothetical protein
MTYSTGQNLEPLGEVESSCGKESLSRRLSRGDNNCVLKYESAVEASQRRGPETNVEQVELEYRLPSDPEAIIQKVEAAAKERVYGEERRARQHHRCVIFIPW